MPADVACQILLPPAASNHEVTLEEGLRLLRSRADEKRFRRRPLVDPAPDHEYDLAGEAAGLSKIVGCEYDFDASGGNLYDYIFDSLGGGGIKICRGLVEKQNLRVAGECAGKRDTLLLAAR